jgi:hypothetical protein
VHNGRDGLRLERTRNQKNSLAVQVLNVRQALDLIRCTALSPTSRL